MDRRGIDSQSTHRGGFASGLILVVCSRSAFSVKRDTFRAHDLQTSRFRPSQIS